MKALGMLVLGGGLYTGNFIFLHQNYGTESPSLHFTKQRGLFGHGAVCLVYMDFGVCVFLVQWPSEFVWSCFELYGLPS